MVSVVAVVVTGPVPSIMLGGGGCLHSPPGLCDSHGSMIRMTVSFALMMLASPTVASAQSLTPHFEAWLNANGYAPYGFERSDISGGSFGGRASGSDPIVNEPVIFVHGNGDRADSWQASRAAFLAAGYTDAELYATTWGPADPLQAAQQYHSREYLEYLREFVEAVLAYTGASRVDIISHSMGVTLMRKVVQGGTANDALGGGAYTLGPALTNAVDAFVGIAGANRGLVSCYLSGPTTPTCGATNGLYPGYLWWGTGPWNVSAFLDDINATTGDEGAYIHTIWSTGDGIIGYGGLVYGQYTSQIPGQNGQTVYSTLGHFDVRDQTASIQVGLVQ